MIVPDRDCVLLLEELLDGVTLGLCDGVTEGVDIREAPFDNVALIEGVPLRVGLPVAVPERELV